MIAKRRRPAHPGQILLEKFLVPRELSQIRLAKHLRIPMQRINQLVNGKRGITPDTAWKLAAAFGTTPELWMKLQAQYDLAKCEPASLLAALRSPAKRPPAKQPSAKQPPAKQPPAKQPPAKQPSAKQPAAKRAPARGASGPATATGAGRSRSRSSR